MSDLNTEFIQVYESLRKAVNRLAGEDESREFQLSVACRKNIRIQRRRTELKYIRDVRNLHVHQQQSSGLPTFALTKAFVDFCRKVLVEIEQAVSASKMGVSLKDLKAARWGDPILPIIETMRINRFSHIPILDDADVVEGVFNESAVMDYLMSSGMVALIEPEHTLNDIRDHCRIGADHIETFRFISPVASEDQVANMFLTVTGLFTRVGAVFVTLGAAPEKPTQRMITAWDVLAQIKVK